MLSRIVGGLVSFLLNKYWSFRSLEHRAILLEGIRFAILYVFSYMLSIVLVYLLVDRLGFPVYVSKLGSDSTCFVVNFCAMRIYVYASSHRGRGALEEKAA